MTRYTNEEVFCEKSYCARHAVKRRLIDQGLIEYKCSECGNEGIHNEKVLKLQLDHINGKSEDNRLENLRFLCPNCHSQTDTYAGKATVGKRVKPKSKRSYHQTKLENDKLIWNTLKSDDSIRFGEWGWKTRLADKIPLSSQKVTPWLRRIDPEFLRGIES